MKYANFSFYTTVAKAAVGVVLTSLLLACGASNPVKDSLVEIAPEIIPTDLFLPMDHYDKEGVKLPYEMAENPYAQQVGRVKKESVSLYIEARRSYKKAKYDFAKGKLNTLLEKDVSLSGPWVMLGDIAMKQQQPEDAEKHFRKALDINPSNINAYLRLAQVLRVKGKFVSAQNVYAEVLALWKDFPEAHLNLGILYDVYLNKPLVGQQHMEAYQFLTDSKSQEVSEWLAEIRSRTGVEYSIKARLGAEPPALSIAGDVEK